MTELSQDARALIEEERSSGAPHGRDKTRVRSRLIAELGSGAFASGAMAGASVSPTDARALAAKVGNGTSIWLKGAATLATVAAGAVAIYVAGAARPQPPANAARAPMQQTLEASESSAAAAEPTQDVPALPAQGLPAQGEVSTASAAAPAVEARGSARARNVVGTAAPTEPRAAAQRAARRVKRSASEPARVDATDEPERGEVAVSAPSDLRSRRKESASTATSSSVAAELALLAQAQRALREGRAADALAFARQHASAFSNGALSEERHGIEALARCMSGERRQASARAFLERAPSSPLAARVRKECGLE